METLILISVGLSSTVFAHLLTLRGRFAVILALLVAAALLYGAIQWYVATLSGWDGLALAIFALIAVVPFGAGLVLGAGTGWLHKRWNIRRGAGDA